MSAEDSYVAFSSAATNLVVDDDNNVQDVFVHQIATGTTERVSVDSSGAEANAWSLLTSIVEEEGRYVVAFESWGSNLVADDVNDMHDIFINPNRG